MRDHIHPANKKEHLANPNQGSAFNFVPYLKSILSEDEELGKRVIQA